VLDAGKQNKNKKKKSKIMEKRAQRSANFTVVFGFIFSFFPEFSIYLSTRHKQLSSRDHRTLLRAREVSGFWSLASGL